MRVCSVSQHMTRACLHLHPVHLRNCFLSPPFEVQEFHPPSLVFLVACEQILRGGLVGDGYCKCYTQQNRAPVLNRRAPEGMRGAPRIWGSIRSGSRSDSERPKEWARPKELGCPKESRPPQRMGFRRELKGRGTLIIANYSILV